MSNQRRQQSKSNIIEVTSQLEAFVVENFQEIVVKRGEIDTDQQIQRFVDIVNQLSQEPDIENFQRVITLLKHNNTAIRSLTAKFVCLICYQNIAMQRKLKELVSSSFIIDHILIFNFPDSYNENQIRVLKRECRKTNAAKKDIVFWYFPLILNPEYENKPTPDDIIQEFVEMILEPRRQFLGFKTELHDPSKYSQSKSPAKQTVSDKPSYTRPIGKVKARAEPRQKASIVRLSSLIQATPSPDLSRSKNSSPTKSEKGSTIQSTPDMNGIKHQRHPTMGTSESPRDEFGVKISPRDFKVATPKFQINLMSKFKSNGSDYTQPHGNNRSIVDSDEINNSHRESLLPPLTTSTQSLTQRHNDYSKRPEGRSLSGRSRDFHEYRSETPSTLLTNPKVDSPQGKYPNFLSATFRGSYTTRKRSTSPDRNRQASADFPRLKTAESQSYISNADKNWTSPLLTKTQYKSVLSLEVERILAKKQFSDLAKYLEQVNTKPFPKEKFIESAHDPARKKPNLPDDDEVDRQAVAEYVKGNTKTIERPPPDGISSKTFNSYRWKNHVAKLQVGNFRPSEENYFVIQSTTQYGRRRTNFVSKPTKHKLLNEEALKVIKELELDVNADPNTYVKHLEKGFNMHQVVYGEKFEKYMDVLQFEKSNFAGDDERHLEEAYGIVDWLYTMKEKKEEEIVEKLETSTEKKLNERRKSPITVPRSRLKKPEKYQDDVFQVERKHTPPTNLLMRKHVRTEDPSPLTRRGVKKKTIVNALN